MIFPVISATGADLCWISLFLLFTEIFYGSKDGGARDRVIEENGGADFESGEKEKGNVL